jgi:spermidine synthase
MVWARQMTLIVGGSTYAFTAVLAVFIFGLALGSLAFRLMVSNERQLPWVIGVSALGIALSTLVGLELQLVLAQSAGSVAPLRADMGFNTLFCLAVSTVLEGPATFFMGLLFPALVQYSGAGRERAGRTVGRMYAWNTAGSIVGATTTAVLLFPTIGAYGAAVAMLALYGASVLLLFPLRGSASPKSPQVLALATLFVALVGGFALRPNESDRMRLNIGYCLYGSTVQQFLQGSDVLMLEEAPTSNVMVLSYDARKMVGSPVETLVNVRVNGKVDGSNGNDMNTQLGTAYLPRFLRPGASDVLVIGFGTGTTAGASLQFPDTRVDCCEIEAAMVRASKFFHDYNHRPELSPNFRAIVEDGRNYIQGTDRTYDLVISEPSNPWIAGVGNLYTVEFYRAVREHLKSGGMLAQWIQAYSLSRTELALVIHTLQGVFEHVGLLRIDDMDLMLVASPAPIVPPSATLDEAQRLVDRSEPIRTALAERFATSDVRALLLWHYVLGNEGVQRIVDAEGQEGINTDNNLRLEFDAPRQLFSADALGHVGVIESVMHAVDAEHFSGLIARWGWTGEQLGALRRLRAHFVKVEHLAMMVAMSELGLAYASESDAPELLADSLLYHPPDDIGEFRIGVRHLVNDSPYEAQRVAAGLGQRGDPVRAAVAYEELLAKMPNSATVYASLAVCYDQLGRVDEVLQMLQRASELDPLNQSTRVVMENFDVELAERRAAEARAEAD